MTYLPDAVLQLLSDVNSYKSDTGTKPALVGSDSLRSRHSSQSSGTLGRTFSASGQLLHSLSSSSNHKDVTGLENEVDILRFELQEAKARMESEVAKAREEALGIMHATGQIPVYGYESHSMRGEETECQHKTRRSTLHPRTHLCTSFLGH